MKRDGGITLIALIITIIVLLILAGVTLNFIRTGNIFGIAGISTEEYRKSQIKENIEVSILDTQLEKGREVTLDEIIDGLIEKGITTEEGSDRESGTVITEEGYIAGIIEKEEGGWEVVIGEKGEIQTSLTYEVIPSQLTSKVTVKIEGKILGEGIKELILPNGETKTYESGTKKISEEYEITANGTYTIKLIGNNGTEIEKVININNILEGIISIVPSTNKPSKTVTIEVIYPEGTESLTKEISIDNGNSWGEYTGEIEITANTTVQARVKNETEVIKVATLTINNIDTLLPKEFSASATVTSNSITISGSTEDQEETETSGSSGIAGYYYRIDNGEWKTNANALETSYTFTGLTQGTPHTVQMKAIDKAGNERETEIIERKTLSIAGEDRITITASTYEWTNKDITITVTWPNDTEGLTKQISTDSGSTWKTYAGTVTISSNCTVKARLIDSTNQTGTVASLTISKIDKTNPTVTATSGEETIEEGDSKDINSYFTYSANGEAPITSVIYTDTSDGNKQISNTNTLSVGTHIIKCTVTKETGAVAVATKTIIVENVVIADGSWNEGAGVNSPMLMEGMTALYWSTDGGVTASTTQAGASPIYSKVGGKSTGAENSAFKWENWYAYVAGDNSTDTKQSRWANAVTDDGSYWVWIPRFKYKISNQPAEAGVSNAGKIEVQFIPTTDQTGVNGYTTSPNTEEERLTTDSSGYIIHPAFENGSSTGKNNSFANGEWDSELPGFWIAKYEMSMEDGSGKPVTTSSSSVGNKALSDSVKMVSKPGVSSWRYIQIGQIYQNCINYDTGKNSHMIKNSEWRSSSIFNA